MLVKARSVTTAADLPVQADALAVCSTRCKRVTA